MRVPRWVKIFIFFLASGVLTATMTGAKEGETPEEETELVVTATRLPVLVSEAPGMVQVIDGEEIQNNNPGFLDLAEFLSLETGVPLSSTGFAGGTSSLGLRGAGSEGVLVMIDGIPVMNPQNGMASLSFIPLEMIGRIEIASGPLSSLYGENALGGVINVITGGEDGGRFLLRGGSFATAGYDLSYRRENWGFGVGSSRSAGPRENSAYEGTWMTVSSRFGWGEWGVDLGFYRYADDKGVPGSIYFPTPDAHEENTQAAYRVDLRRGLEKGELLLRLYRSEFGDLYRDDRGISRHYSYRNGLEGQLEWFFSPALSAVAVAKKEDSGVESSVLGERSAAAENLAVQLNWSLREDLYLYLGDFYTRQSAYGDDNSFRLGAVHRLKPGLFIKALYSTAFRAPTFNELYWPAEEWARGNPALLPEKGETWEAVLEYQWLADLVTKVSLYHSAVNNLIQWSEMEDGVWMPQNHGRVRLEGIDTSMAWKFRKPWSLQFQAHLLSAHEYDEATGDFTRALTTKAPLGAAVGLLYTGEGLQAGLFARYYGAHGETAEIFLADLALTYRLRPGLSFQIGIKNLLDREYAFISGYPMPGRNLLISLGYRF